MISTLRNTVLCGVVAIAAMGFAYSQAAQAQVAVTLTIQDASGFADGTVLVPVTVASPQQPATVFFKVAYDAAKLSVVEVLPGAAATAANKSVTLGVDTAGRATVLVSGLAGGTDTIADGTLVTLAMRVSSSATIGELLTLDGLQPSATEATGGTALAVTIVDGTLTVSDCVAPGVPAGVAASDSTYGDRVAVTWGATSGATQYLVYRHTADAFASATLAATVRATSFEDFNATAAIRVVSGCPRRTRFEPVTHYYWIVAQNACGTSAASASDAGFRGSTKALNLSVQGDDVLPSPDSPIALDSPLAIRLRSKHAIAPSSVWGIVTTKRLSDTAVEWRPNSASGQDGWVVYRPSADWQPGESITFTVGAKDASGANLGPVTYTFIVEPPAEVDAASLSPQEPFSGSALVYAAAAVLLLWMSRRNRSVDLS